MITTIALDVGGTLMSDDRVWAGWADWLGVRPHTLSALVGIVVSQGRDNADALRMVRPDVNLSAEYAARSRRPGRAVGRMTEPAEPYVELQIVGDVWFTDLGPDDVAAVAAALRAQADRLDHEVRPRLIAYRDDWAARRAT